MAFNSFTNGRFRHHLAEYGIDFDIGRELIERVPRAHAVSSEEEDAGTAPGETGVVLPSPDFEPRGVMPRAIGGGS